MRKLFVQFFLLLFVCFLVMAMLVGLVYKFTAERAGRQSMDDLMKSSLYLMRSELRDTPLKDWNKTIATLDLNLSFQLHIEPLGKQNLSEELTKRLRLGEIIALDDRYTFMQRIPRSHYVLVVGPIPYLFYLHQMRILDLVLLIFIGMSLALPVFLWMRPHWQDLLKLENAAQRLGAGHLDERTYFEPTSSLNRLGVAFNQMADNISTLIASKKQLIDGIAHELRTPLVRLRYRLAMSENLSESEQQALHRDIGQLESLIDELLTYARLDRPQLALNIEPIDLPNWLKDKVADMQLIHSERDIELSIPHVGDFGGVDLRLMERVLDNLVNNALRYSEQRLRVGLWFDGDRACLQVEDDGPGIPPDERERVFEPFVRLDPSRDRATGGCGLGLAIVHSIAVAYQGQVYVEASSLGGASFRFCWPIKQTF
ncbi:MULTISPECIES: two-component system sensor histidine kinase RstB [unclassified Serratia (in: enterobacteria)]|uniref:two-component system sensor histidine kinase RstB n=1 Tax=unclassified Serratia (in: enterobacteria) TaxID=2647522 RepID=UPI00050833EC|nr:MULTISPECIES: two-component system sensor histidine kinase RstB [unclassified Serratia (in: enterobacteria)]KFK94617.1 sensor protein RstB [Serratia sp. Ag2]KFK95837.1 sensor protein RstB [Serratia sp. Ag1]